MKVYSLNDEEFRFYTICEVMWALEDTDDLVAGAEYFEIETKPVDLVEYLCVGRILEDAEERAYDDLGEVAEDAFSVTHDAAAEIDALLKAWAAKHLTGRYYWRCVGKSKRLTVTADDVAEYSRTEDAT